MDEREVMLSEYNNLWQEKLVHKQSIRKFHNYLTYITAISTLALAFYGLSMQDVLKYAADPAATNQFAKNSHDVIRLFFVPFAPVLILTLTFPLNDLFHIYVIGTQIGEIEKKINAMSGGKKVLLWEHAVCPIVYGGRQVPSGDSSENKITNIISAGDGLLLVPLLAAVFLGATYLAMEYIDQKAGWEYSLMYAAVVFYMLSSLIMLGRKLKHYTKANSVLTSTLGRINQS